jgi:hypothetical protein
VGGRQSALENLEVMTLFGSAYNGKRVLVTGHTGFKGAWLCEWLLGLGAEVTGLSLPPPTEPSLFARTGLGPAAAPHFGRHSGATGAAPNNHKPNRISFFISPPSRWCANPIAAREKRSTSTPWAL